MGTPRRLFCPRCGEAGDLGSPPVVCARCATVMEIEMDLTHVARDLAGEIRRRPRGLWRWREFLPVEGPAAVLSLGEGDTPLVHSARLAREVGIERLYVKNDTLLPTGSLKDRSVAVAVSRAREVKADRVGVSSSGNHAASVAAYAAAAGLPCVVMVPADTAPGKIAQARVHGATVVAVQANFDTTAALFREAIRTFGWYSCLSSNPWRNEGKKSYAFEIWEQLDGEAPDWMIHPIAGGLGVSACWKGWRELRQLGWTARLPRMVAAQARAAAPIVAAWEARREDVAPVTVQDTVAQALAVGQPALGWRCLSALRDTSGVAAAATDEEILSAQALLARTTGIFCEPSAATSLAVAIGLRRRGLIRSTDLAVCVVTGHGLKQPEAALAHAGPLLAVPPTLAAVEHALTRQGG
ncbi:MAG TPA: threonine synthase [Methylomirabilota bacterium]|nr:threonine synthase [Methylomirabilota bacterium]